ncbi:hypothetical protein MASR2M17_16440 [Aminivibrio sp.]
MKNKNIEASANVLGIELCDKTLGLGGAGRIGSHVAQIAGSGLGMKVLVFDPYLSEGARKPILDTGRFGYIDKESDVISLHCPVTPETTHLFDKKEIAADEKECDISQYRKRYDY